MGIALIFLAIGIILILSGILIMDFRLSRLDFLATPALIVGIVSVAPSALFFIMVVFDIALKDIHTFEKTNGRNYIVRMLKENYDINALNAALNFNTAQKMCNYRQGRFMWKYLGTDGVCLDTVEIPSSQFTPTLNVNVK